MPTIREKILEIYKCVDPNCDGNGTIPHRVGEDEWELQQCKYCYTVRFQTIDELEALISQSVIEVRKETADYLVKRFAVIHDDKEFIKLVAYYIATQNKTLANKGGES